MKMFLLLQVHFANIGHHTVKGKVEYTYCGNGLSSSTSNMWKTFYRKRIYNAERGNKCSLHITYLWRWRTTHNEREQHECKQSEKILRSESSLYLNK